MRICFLRHGAFPGDPILKRAVECMLEVGYHVDIICLSEEDTRRRECWQGAQVYRIPVGHQRSGVIRYAFEYGVSFLYMSLLVTWLQIRNRYDCIQVSAMPDFLVFAARIPRWLGAKVILHLYEPTPELFITKFGRDRHPHLFRIQAWLEQAAIAFADHAFAVSDPIRDRYIERGAAPSKLTVLPNVSTEFFEENPLPQVATSNGEFHLITHGLVEERYGHETVVRAIDILRNEIPELRYDITGGGEYQDEIKKVVRALQLDDRVIFHGYLSIPKLLELLARADVGVITMFRSPYSELIDTIKMYEYTALKKPVIVSRLQTIDSRFDDTCLKKAIPGDPQDVARCIRELYASPEEREQLAENAFRRYQTLKWSTSKHIYLDAVTQLVQTGSVGR